MILFAVPAATAQQPSPPEVVAQLAGNYLLPDGNVLGINAFSGNGGPPVPFFTDYTTGAIRTLSPLGDGRFGMGPSLGAQAPLERVLRIVRDGAGPVVAIGLQRPGEPEAVARRIPDSVQEVTFRSGETTLSGTLILPNRPGPHAAIVLLHGSGPLTRYSFGPYPRFFASLGLAVLIYDKRGTGMSTGPFFSRDPFYPEPYLQDAVAALRFLKARPEIDARQVGMWGTSEGGMLTTQVAAVEDAAFAINSSGFMMPLWEQVLYNIEAQLRADGFSEAEVAAAAAFETLAMDVMRTGVGWPDYEKAQSAARQTKWWQAYFGSSNGFASLDAIRWQWEHVYSFDPLPTLTRVKAPVLGLFGSLDTSTPASRSAANMEAALRAAGNRDVTVRVFERANHPLMDARTGGNSEVPGLTRMTPELFSTLRTWLLARLTRLQ